MNTQKIIEQAIRALPSDREFNDVKFYLNKAIEEAVKVDKKKAKKLNVKKEETALQQWQNKIQNAATSPTALGNLTGTSHGSTNALKQIQEMIKQEKKKLEEIAKNKNGGPNGLLID